MCPSQDVINRGVWKDGEVLENPLLEDTCPVPCHRKPCNRESRESWTKEEWLLAVVSHFCNPRTREDQEVGSQPGLHSKLEASLGSIARFFFKK